MQFSLTVPDPIEEAPGASISEDRHTATWRIDDEVGALLATTESRPTVPSWALVVVAFVVIVAAVWVIARR